MRFHDKYFPLEFLLQRLSNHLHLLNGAFTTRHFLLKTSGITFPAIAIHRQLNSVKYTLLPEQNISSLKGLNKILLMFQNIPLSTYLRFQLDACSRRISFMYFGDSLLHFPPILLLLLTLCRKCKFYFLLKQKEKNSLCTR